jgi:8-oxo-dGTP pyrophosphatase MutT (NUDIX family)
MVWHPHVTVATLVHRDGQFLMVKEWDHGRVVLNQPAGHLEPGESLMDAALRETREETGWSVRLVGALGISRYVTPTLETYIRVSFVAEPLAAIPDAQLDEGIIDALWMDSTDLEANRNLFRSPLVAEDLRRFAAGICLPLTSLYDWDAPAQTQAMQANTARSDS